MKAYFFRHILSFFLLICFSIPRAACETGGKPAFGEGEVTDTMIIGSMPVLPDTISFAGETVPLHKRQIREQLDREFLYIHSQTGTLSYIIKLANRWFPVIEAILTEQGIPADFKYLCIAESNLQNLISKSFAVGFWQFMPRTAPGYNLEISNTVDERYHVSKSTVAACKYLHQAYKKFGSWTAAAASYNCGQGAYHAATVFQQTSNYYDLDIRDETNKYIFRIVSFKQLLEHQANYGFTIPDTALYPPIVTRVVQVKTRIPNLASFAIKNSITFKELKMLNPWLRKHSLEVKPGKTYHILLPVSE